MLWRDAVFSALHRFCDRHKTRCIRRQVLIDEELEQIARETQAEGPSPDQTLSRVLQELRDEEILYFMGRGTYLLADTPVCAEAEDLPDDALDFAIKKNRLEIGMIPATEAEVVARQRRGQARIRILTLENYGGECAFCNVADEGFLVASHISRWADDPDARGDLSNTICLCRVHDPLFEYGWFSISDDYQVVKRTVINSKIIAMILARTNAFRAPMGTPPAPEFLQKHRLRTGL